MSLRHPLRVMPFLTMPFLLALFLGGCSHPSFSADGSDGQAEASQAEAGPASPLLFAPGAPLLPDPKLTPGATRAVTVQQISVPGYAHSVRDVSIDEKKAVYAEYHIRYPGPGKYEVDHLIPLEIGGSNSIRNLWPQAYFTQPWNAHVKDDLENKLHDLVCSGQVPLATAQQAIAVNWIAAYKEYFHTSIPLPGEYDEGRWHRDRHGNRDGAGRPRAWSSPGAAPADPHGLVWVNTRSGKFFRPGSRYYGHTRQGQYMTESQAEQQGDIAARGY
jgi:hypothetical protein